VSGSFRESSLTYGKAYISDATIADLKTFDVFAHFDDFSDSFMTRDELGVISLIWTDVTADKRY
jgi:hypothetical protein